MRVFRLRQFLLLCFAGAGILSTHASSQVLPFRTFTQRDGLPVSAVHVVLQDRRGYLWIGTGEGVSVYNGYEFVNHHSPGNPSLHYITALEESRSSDGMWIGTHGGGAVFFAEGVMTPLAPDQIGTRGVGSIVEDTLGNVWCVVDTILLRRPNGVTAGQIMDNRFMRKVLPGPDGSILAIGRSALVRFATTGALLDSITLPGATEAILLSSGLLCIGTASNELVIMDGKEEKSRIRLPLDQIYGMCEGRTGDIWVAGWRGAARVSIHDPDSVSITHYTTAHGLVNDVVHAVFLDREENLWFATAGGLQMLMTRDVSTIVIPELPLGVFYQPLARDSSGRIWAILPGGLMELTLKPDGSSLHRLHTMERLDLARQPTGIRFDADGRLWVSDKGHHLHQYEPGRAGHPVRLRSFDPRDGDESKTLLSYLVDKEGRIWCSLYPTSVDVFDRSLKRIRRLTPDDGIPAADIRTFMQDRNDRVWMGGVMGGIAIVEPDLATIVTLKAGDGLPDERVRFLLEDRRGRVVIGTRVGGVTRYEAGKFTTLTIREGLVSDCVWWVDEDDRGRYWIGTQQGMQSIEAHTFQPDPPHSYLTTTGAIACIAGTNSVVGYRYGSLLMVGLESPTGTGVPPLVHITRALVHGQQVHTDKAATVPYDHNTCILEFTGIKFSDEARTRYRYRILEADTNWSAATLERRIVLAGLSPGRYTIQVSAVSGEGQESSKPASFSLTILPPIWRTWWAYITYGLILAGGLVAWRRFEISRLRRRERQEADERENRLRLELEKQQTRMQIARDLHDEVGSTLSSITFFAQALTNQEHAGNDGKKFLSLINESSAHAKDAMRDIIWSIDPASDNWNTVISTFRRYASELLESRGIAHDIEMPLPLHDVVIDPQTRRHLWLIFKEVLVNAATHAQCKEVRIRLEAGEEVLLLQIQDDGVGFDPGQIVAGNGVNNIRTRASRIGATVDLLTARGSGTQWTLRIPLRTPVQRNT